MGNNHYRTANTALATTLQTEGFTLLEVTTQPDQYNKFRLEAVFVFEDCPALHDTVYLWDTAKANGNHNIWYHTYRATVKRAKMAVAVANAPVNGAGEEHGGHNKENKYLCDSPAQVASPAPTSY
jgi:hypothetical protein